VTKDDDRYVRLVTAVKHLESLRSHDKTAYRNLQRTCSKKDTKIQRLQRVEAIGNLEKDIAYMDGAIRVWSEKNQDLVRENENLRKEIKRLKISCEIRQGIIEKNSRNSDPEGLTPYRG